MAFGARVTLQRRLSQPWRRTVPAGPAGPERLAGDTV